MKEETNRTNDEGRGLAAKDMSLAMSLWAEAYRQSIAELSARDG